MRGHREATIDYLDGAQMRHKRSFSMRRNSLLAFGRAEELGGGGRRLALFLRRLFHIKKRQNGCTKEQAAEPSPLGPATAGCCSCGSPLHASNGLRARAHSLARPDSQAARDDLHLFRLGHAPHHQRASLRYPTGVRGAPNHRPLGSVGASSSAESSPSPSSSQSVRRLRQDHWPDERARATQWQLAGPPSTAEDAGHPKPAEQRQQHHKQQSQIEAPLASSPQLAGGQLSSRSESSLSEHSTGSCSTNYSTASQQLRRHLDEAYKRHRKCTSQKEKDFIDSINVLRQASRHALDPPSSHLIRLSPTSQTSGQRQQNEQQQQQQQQVSTVSKTNDEQTTSEPRGGGHNGLGAEGQPQASTRRPPSPAPDLSRPAKGERSASAAETEPPAPQTGQVGALVETKCPRASPQDTMGGGERRDKEQHGSEDKEASSLGCCCCLCAAKSSLAAGNWPDLCRLPAVCCPPGPPHEPLLQFGAALALPPCCAPGPAPAGPHPHQRIALPAAAGHQQVSSGAPLVGRPADDPLNCPLWRSMLLLYCQQQQQQLQLSQRQQQFIPPLIMHQQHQQHQQQQDQTLPLGHHQTASVINNRDQFGGEGDAGQTLPNGAAGPERLANGPPKAGELATSHQLFTSTASLNQLHHLQQQQQQHQHNTTIDLKIEIGPDFLEQQQQQQQQRRRRAKSRLSSVGGGGGEQVHGCSTRRSNNNRHKANTPKGHKHDYKCTLATCDQDTELDEDSLESSSLNDSDFASNTSAALSSFETQASELERNSLNLSAALAS